MLNRLQCNGLRLKQDKCEFLQSSVNYLGFVLDKQGIRPSAIKVEAVTKMPAPTNVHELRSFLGMVQHYGAFIRNLATLSVPLNELLRKEVPWHWEKRQQKAFTDIKQSLVSMDVLVHYNPELPVVLSCDASAYGIGAVIAHRMPNGLERPVAFASRTLNSAERNYGQNEKEALSIIYGVKKFHQYLFGQKFLLQTDHKPLLAIFGPAKGIPVMTLCRL